MLYFKLYNFYITQSVSVSNYYLCIWVNGCRIYYQLSTCNKLPQSAQMLNFLQIFCKSQNLSFTIVVHHQCVAKQIAKHL